MSVLPVAEIYSFESSSSAEALIALLRGAVQSSGTVTGTFRGSTFVLTGRSLLVGGFQRHFYGRVVDLGHTAIIEGSFHLMPAVRVLLLTIASLVMLAGLATSVQQRSVTPGLIILLIVLWVVLDIRRRVNRSASREEAVLKLIIDVANGR
jgi:hypothetical protein